jgi:hypothetical protein
VRDLLEDPNEGESNDASTQWILALVRLESKPDKRLAATIAFGAVTSKAERSQSLVETVTERVPDTNWYRIKPTQPLAPGEYGLVRIPQNQNMFGSAIYDFAIDPTAAENSDPVRAETEKPL